MTESQAVRYHKGDENLKKVDGRIVSKAKSAAAKSADSPLAMWRKAVKQAGGLKEGKFTPIKKGTAIYKKAKKIYDRM
tara:strand:+ start:849 stop:1082 length:234 start_codon:yes stop_codon:yes gene_type:complete